MARQRDAVMSIDSFSVFCEGLDHPECATRGPDGVTYAGGEAGQIYRVTLDGTHEQIASTEGFVLGMCLDANRNVYACDMAKRAVMKATPDGKVSMYSDGTRQRKMANPNYPVFDRDGNLYVTDSGRWQQHDGCLYCIRPGGETALVSQKVTHFANGCCLSHDGRSLYVVMSLMPGVVKLPIRTDGSLGDPEPVVDLPGTVPDGVAFDVQGHLYVSCYAPDIIYRVSPSGELTVLAHDPLRITFASPTNIVFSGEDRKTLVVSNLARWHLSKAQMPHAGQPLNYPHI
ncbi:MAG: SMP-30/gluconolactonase/LRE family protein [Vicinamibacteraceae bacterium]